MVLLLSGGSMHKKMLIAGFLLAAFGFSAMAQNADAEKVVISGDLTTIYTLGNASANDQRINTEPTTVGAFFNNPYTGTRKNGFYTAANLYATLRPFDWLEGYFKVYSVHRPGSFYMPLQMENINRNDFAPTLDVVYGKISVFDALDVNLPVDLSLKAGKYKAQAAQYGIISKYKTEQVLFMMNTKTDFTYEMEVVLNDPVKIGLSAATNYLFNQSVQRYYDEDGSVKHGNQVLNEFAPQFLIGLRLFNFENISAELLYGQNVSNIYSGNAVGFSGKYMLEIDDAFSIPIGLSFAFHEKNIDLLGQAAIAEDLKWPNATATLTTMDFRESLAAALGAGIRYDSAGFDAEFNIAGAYYLIKHYYRADLSVIKMSIDAAVTFADNYFIGAGIIMGSLTDAVWKTRDGVTDDDYNRTFALAENLGFEVYGGLNFGRIGRFVIGFNQNKGISLNNMLEAKHEGQIKFKQKDSNWGTDQLAEAGGLYFKFAFRF